MNKQTSALTDVALNEVSGGLGFTRSVASSCAPASASLGFNVGDILGSVVKTLPGSIGNPPVKK